MVKVLRISFNSKQGTKLSLTMLPSALGVIVYLKSVFSVTSKLLLFIVPSNFCPKVTMCLSIKAKALTNRSFIMTYVVVS